jgi:hypothetical protein
MQDPSGLAPTPIAAINIATTPAASVDVCEANAVNFVQNNNNNSNNHNHNHNGMSNSHRNERKSCQSEKVKQDSHTIDKPQAIIPTAASSPCSEAAPALFPGGPDAAAQSRRVQHLTELLEQKVAECVNLRRELAEAQEGRRAAERALKDAREQAPIACRRCQSCQRDVPASDKTPCVGRHGGQWAITKEAKEFLAFEPQLQVEIPAARVNAASIDLKVRIIPHPSSHLSGVRRICARARQSA